MPSSPIALIHTNSEDSNSLIAHLTRVPDPRKQRGRRYQLTSLLTLMTCAVMTGMRSFTAIGEWAADLSYEQLDALGLRTAPHESGLRKLFARIDVTALEACIAAWVYTRSQTIAGRRIIAIDGKTVRGARTQTRRAPHLLTAVGHDSGIIYRQTAVDAKTNEIPAARDLITALDPSLVSGAVITLDALHTQTDTAEFIVDHGADYVFTVKGNQGSLHRQLKALPWAQVPATTGREKGRGRGVRRTMKTIVVPEWVVFPHARQVAQLRRTRTVEGKTTVEVVYLITSMNQHDAPPELLAGWVRSHWTIENKVHWVRDVTFDEDRSQVRTGHLPQVMAAFRNLVITRLRFDGVVSIAERLRYYSRHPGEAIAGVVTS